MGQFLHQLDPEIWNKTRQLEKLQLKIITKTYSIMFNKTCLSNDLMAKYTIYIYIYVCVCLCVCAYVCVDVSKVDLALCNPQMSTSHKHNQTKKGDLSICWPNLSIGGKMRHKANFNEGKAGLNSKCFLLVVLNRQKNLIRLSVIFWSGPKILFQGNTPEGSDTFQRPVIERDRVGGLRLMIWDKVKVILCHYSHAPEESNLWTAWQLFLLDDD